jgi:putative transposase
VCVRNRRTVFSKSEYAHHVIDQFLQLSKEEKFEVLAYCAMPDHFHALPEGCDDDADLRRLMHRWKLRTGHWWRNRVERSRLWQEGYYDHVLRPTDPEAAVVRYIVANPVRAGLVASLEEYPLTGSSRYDIRELAETFFDWRPNWK